MDRPNDIVSAGRRFGAPLALCIVAVAVFLLPGFSGGLQYDRAAVGDGQLWRLATCQLVHATPDHLLWDVAATLVLGLLIASKRPRLFLFVTGIAGAVIPLAVHVALPSLATYCGLSGIASALFAAYAVTVLAESARDRRWGPAAATCLVGAAFAAKLVYEAATGRAVFVDLGTAALVPVPLAHLVGAVVGSAAAVFGLVARYNRRPACDAPSASSVSSLGSCS